MMSFADWTARATPLETGGLRVATHDDGPQDAPVVTYLHGFPASSLDIVPTAERIGDERRILTLDFPGFGASDKPTGHRYSIHACADAVEDLWAFHGVTGSVLVAHDYGVSVAQELLARRLDGRLEVEVARHRLEQRRAVPRPPPADRRPEDAARSRERPRARGRGRRGPVPQRHRGHVGHTASR